MRLARLSFIAIALLCACLNAWAVTTCVNTPAQLAAALSAAAGNGQDDTIYLETGTYLLSSELQHYATAAETHRLAIIGGQSPGCAGYAASGQTVLDGQDLTRVLTISAQGEVDIGRITFTHGRPTQYFGGALSVATTAGEIYLFDNVFAASQTASGAGGGALYIQVPAAHSGYLWSNLFLANASSGGGAVYAYNQGNLYITGNTVVGNTLLNHTGIGGGLDVTGGGHYWLTNNILWNNENTDVYDQAGHTDYANNDLGTKDGFAPLSESNELNVDPGFVGFFSFVPGPTSPLVNAGLDTAPGGIGGCCDASGGPRKLGTHVDIGAYEVDLVFRDGFGN